MGTKTLKVHTKGQKHIGKTKWGEVMANTNKPIVNDENPEIVFKRVFTKPEKDNK